MKGFLRTAFYARVSSQRQADEKTIESQRHEILARIERDQLHFDPSFAFCDDGYSGSELYRPALEALRDQVAASLIDRVYIHSPDRLARKFAHQALLLEEFQKHQCEVVFLNQEGLPDSPETNLLIHMQGMIAEYEREKILERTRRGRRYAAARGSVSVFSGAPYGYRYVCKTAGDGQARWEIDPQESKAVRLMFHLAGVRGYTLAAVCRELESRRIRTRTRQAQWHRATVRGILINPAYCGEAKYGRERLVPRKPGKRAKRGDPPIPRATKVAVATLPEEQIMIPVPALVSKAVFEEARRKMDENRQRQRQRQDGPKHLLSGLLICGQCGSAYCARVQGSGAWLYYRCLGTDKYRLREKTICDNRSVKGQPLEELVWTEVCKLMSDPARVEAELERRQTEEPSASSQLTEVQRRVNDLRGRLDRLIDAYSGGFIEKAEFESRIRPLRDQHDRELATLLSLRGQIHEQTDAISAKQALSNLAAQVGAKLDTASTSLKRELIVTLVRRIEIHPQEIRLSVQGPPAPFCPRPR